MAKESYDQQVKAMRVDFSDEKLQSIIDRAVEEAKASSKPTLGDVFDTQSFTRYRELARAAALG